MFKFFRHYIFLIVTGVFSFSVSSQSIALTTSEADYELKLLGKYLFFDKLSHDQKQSCSSCHSPATGWTNENSTINKTVVAVPGAIHGTSGNLKPPSNAYASFINTFEIACTHNPLGKPCGGNFWNGRALGNSADKIESNLVTNPNKTLLFGPDRNAVESVAGLWANGSGLPIFVGDKQLTWVKYLGPIADQAHASPFINPVEQGLLDKVTLCRLVATKPYAELFKLVWDSPVDCSMSSATDITFARFAIALSAYQSSKEVNPFDSKRDRALKEDKDHLFPLDGFTAEENLGHDLFHNTSKITPALAPKLSPPPVLTDKVYKDLPITNCQNCHTQKSKTDQAFFNATNMEQIGPQLGTDPQELFTDMSFHNIGTPPNWEVPNAVYLGLNDKKVTQLAALTGNDGVVTTTNQKGLIKVPTLRNVDKRPNKNFVKAYTHNGFFKSLEGIVHFYNTASLNPATTGGPRECTKLDGGLDGLVNEKEAKAKNCWPLAENIGGSTRTIGGLNGDLNLTAAQEKAVVAYVKTLTDLSPTPVAPVKFDVTKFKNGLIK
jgi:cytochrome c peroxidase